MDRQHRELTKRSGFTLIEVLVVVAIIALLVAILLPSLSRARAQARNTACLANLHTFGVNLMGYSVTHGDKFPGETGAEEPGWTWIVARENGIKRLADADGDGIPEGYTMLNWGSLGFFQCPERSAANGVPFLDYVHNVLDPDGPDVAGNWIENKQVDLNTYRRPADVAFILDAEKEDNNIGNPTGPSGPALKGARLNTEEGINAILHGGSATGHAGGIDIFDIRTGSHVPQGKGNVNVDDTPGFRRAARKMHLNRFTNTMFLDGHASGLQLFNRDSRQQEYADWLRLFGVRDYQRAASRPIK